MITTPLGNIEIWIDGNPVDYEDLAVPKDRTCPDLDGRYLIRVEVLPDGKMHEILCLINGHTASDRDNIEPGERLELKSFYHGSCKLSIGMEGDTGYLLDGTRIGEYDYDTEYLQGGVKYALLPDTRTSQYLFGIAWINEVSPENEVQTWYGADPTIMPGL